MRLRRGEPVQRQGTDKEAEIAQGNIKETPQQQEVDDDPQQPEGDDQGPDTRADRHEDARDDLHHADHIHDGLRGEGQHGR